MREFIVGLRRYPPGAYVYIQTPALDREDAFFHAGALFAWANPEADIRDWTLDQIKEIYPAERFQQLTEV